MNAQALLLKLHVYLLMWGGGSCISQTWCHTVAVALATSSCLWLLWWSRRECFFKSQHLYIEREGRRERAIERDCG